jgi:hypothetical protein
LGSDKQPLEDSVGSGHAGWSEWRNQGFSRHINRNMNGASRRTERLESLSVYALAALATASGRSACTSSASMLFCSSAVEASIAFFAPAPMASR